MTIHRIDRCRLAIAVVAALIVAVHAAADNTAGPFFINVDTQADFDAVGAFTTVDTDGPPNGIAAPVVEWLEVRGANWIFAIRHINGAPPYDNPRVGNAGGFNQVSIEVKGAGLPSPPAPVNQFGHITPAPGGIHAGELENNLPPVSDGNPKDVEFGGNPVRLLAANNVEHPPNKHIDFYQVATRVAALGGQPAVPPAVLPGPNNFLTGACKIRGAHREKKPFSFPRDGAISSTPEGGSTVSYDAETKTLKFSIGWINGLSLNGGEFGVVEPAYADDAILRAKWTASSITLVERTQDGFVFAEGTLSIADQSGSLRLTADFGEFLIADSTSIEPLQSFALVRRFGASQTDAAGSKSFLDDFVARNFFGEGVSAERWAHWIGIDFAVLTKQDLVKLTEGFTKSAHDVPATYVLVANYDEDVEPVQEY